MIFRITRTSEKEPPCSEATHHDGWATKFVSANILKHTEFRNTRDSGQKAINGTSIMAYEEPCGFWIIEFATLEDLMVWVRRMGEEIIIKGADVGTAGTYDYWLQDCKTKLDGSIEIYDGYRE